MAKNKHRNTASNNDSNHGGSARPEFPPTTSALPSSASSAPSDAASRSDLERLRQEAGEAVRQQSQQLSSRMEEISRGLEQVDEVKRHLQRLEEDLGEYQKSCSGDAVRDIARQTLEEQFAVLAENLAQKTEKAKAELHNLLDWIEQDAANMKKMQQTMPIGGIEALRQQAAELESQLGARNRRIEELQRALDQNRVALGDAQRQIHQLTTQDNRVLMDDVLTRERDLREREAGLMDNLRLVSELAEAKRSLASYQAQEKAQARQAVDLAESERTLSLLEESRHNEIELQGRLNRAEEAVRRLEKESVRFREERRQLLARVEELSDPDREERFQEAKDNARDFQELYRQREAMAEKLLREKEKATVALQKAEDARLDAEATCADAVGQARAEMESELLTRLKAVEERVDQQIETRVKEKTLETQQRVRTLFAQTIEFKRELEEAKAAVVAREKEVAELKEWQHQKRDEVLSEIYDQKEKERGQLEELRAQALQALQQERETLQVAVFGLRAECDALCLRKEESERAVSELAGESARLSALNATLEAEIGQRQERIDELRRKEEQMRLVDLPRADRLASLIQPRLLPKPTRSGLEEETAWLHRLAEEIRKAGFVFPNRLLHAFHTALKCSAISPLTVLAGISGTGKSELPRLYADQGGIHFLNLAVQPNWDSPDDLFGFFNYTDGRYRATDLSRVLYQLANPGNEGFLHDQMVLVLLDEMNIARVEYYFAELLSRLEIRRHLRRGSDGWERAAIRIDAGAGEAAEHLFLDHNLLFVGTMNEDESTLTLSDKVKDRAVLLTFPSPTRFVDRSLVSCRPREKALSRASWESWVKDGASLQGDRRTTLEDLAGKFNESLAEVQRAIGHRVFQAVTSYAANYPVTEGPDAAFRDAVSDLFAQKLIPKLIGVECRSRQGAACLKRIEPLVPEDLLPAFLRARAEEYFSWQGSRELFEPVVPQRPYRLEPGQAIPS